MTERSTAPDAPMDMRLRITTSIGPRTVTITSIPHRDACAIADAIRLAGHEAALVDHTGGKAMSTHIKELKRAARVKAAAASASTNVVPIKLSKKGKTHAGVHGGTGTGT